MAIFEYQAMTSAGRLMKGSLEADSPDHAREILEEMRLSIGSIEKTGARKPRTPIGRSEFALFNQQLAGIVRAGIPLERGLRELAVDAGSRSMRKLINAVADELEAGVSLEDALARRQKLFPPLYHHIVTAGVRSGRLSEMLLSLNRHLEISEQTRRIVVEAVAYPATVLALAAAVITGVLVLIVPQFKAMFADMNVPLRGLTRLFLGLSDVVVPVWILTGILIASAIVVWVALSRSAAGSRF